MSSTTINRTILIRFIKILFFCSAILSTTYMTLKFSSITSAPTAAFSFLIIVLLSAYFGDYLIAIASSILATLCFDYFYLPPFNTFKINEFSDWISLLAFFLATLMISHLTAAAAESKKTSTELNETMLLLTKLERWLSSIPEEQLALPVLARGILEIFSLELCSIYVYAEGKWKHTMGLAASPTLPEEHLKIFEEPSINLIELAAENILGVRYTPLTEGLMPPVLLIVRGQNLPDNALELVSRIIALRLGLLSDK